MLSALPEERMGIGRGIQVGPMEISVADWLALLGKKVPFHRNVRLAAGCRQLLQAALPSHGIGQHPFVMYGEACDRRVNQISFPAKVIWVRVSLTSCQRDPYQHSTLAALIN